MNVHFAVITDLHVEIMHDCVARMQAFWEAAVAEHVDFLLHLGDMQYPEADFLRQYAPESLEKRESRAWFVCDRDDEKLAVKRLAAQTGLKLYGVLGNHDMDSCDKATACRYWGMPGPRYSFVEGGVRFIALDTNFVREGAKMLDFDHCNYRGRRAEDIGFLTRPQLDWLEQEILRSQEPCVLLSHAALGDDLLCAHDRAALWDMLERVNSDRRRVILALNGHNHVDGMSVRRGVPFISVNSASNIWIGHQYDTVRYSETICRTYPHIKGCAPYRDALFALFAIDDSGISMQGRSTGFVGPSPQELGFPKEASFFEPAPLVRSRSLPLRALAGEGPVAE